ncbi:hypothetical protein [Azorhizobium doebereinerae]|uniref:hypothetical protein n=1 Tax=Azorhizobium doebereinerae TaxID=281091 RepID=UPI000428318D|nr:hypothetical protein [Azorhizobium doebereinerae]
MSPRARFTPAGAVKVSDKLSDAVAFVYERRGRPIACVYVGNQSKPVSAYSYRSALDRERSIRAAFEARRAAMAVKRQRQEERKAYRPACKPGDVLGTCWGYEQTNREFFEVIEVKGKFVILRELAQERIDTGWSQGKAVPLPGSYVGEPIRRLAQPHGIRIDSCRLATPAAVEDVAGVKVVKPVGWSSYA